MERYDDRDAADTPERDGKRGREYEQERGRQAATTGSARTRTMAAEENLSALSNLCVEEMQSQSQASNVQPSPSAGATSSRSKVRRTSAHARPSASVAGASEHVSKSSLSFILGEQEASDTSGILSQTDSSTTLMTRSRSTGDLAVDTFLGGSPTHFTSSGSGSTSASVITSASSRTPRASSRQGADGKRRARRPPSRICKHEGCEQYVVDQGLCVRHGGGKRCLTEGCSSRAKHQGRCWRHGGSTECKVPTCRNRAKSRGYCWSHGGGTKCKADTCEKIAISNGLCWAHGGGKRCSVRGCRRQAYERTDNLCNNHFQERQQGVVVAVASAEPGSEAATTGASTWRPEDEEKPPAPSSPR